MDSPKFIVSNQKEDSISIHMVKMHLWSVSPRERSLFTVSKLKD